MKFKGLNYCLRQYQPFNRFRCQYFTLHFFARVGLAVVECIGRDRECLARTNLAKKSTVYWQLAPGLYKLPTFFR